MPTELTVRDIDLLLESLTYSKLAIGDGQDTSASKRSRIEELDSLINKLKQIKLAPPQNKTYPV